MKLLSVVLFFVLILFIVFKGEILYDFVGLTISTVIYLIIATLLIALYKRSGKRPPKNS